MSAIAACAWAGDGSTLRLFGHDGLALATFSAPDGFSLSFVHSINLSPVDEFFSVGSGLVLERTEFDQLSTGMPSGAEDGFSLEGGRFVTRPMRRIGALALRVSPVPGHVLGISGRRIPLTRWARPGGLLIFKSGPRQEP